MIHIIVVDDDPGIQEAFNVIFDPMEFRVEIHGNGEKILSNEFEAPAIFILDKQLSGVDGLDVCRHLKSHERTMHIPVVMLSASPHIHRLAPAAGADAAIEKPFRLKDLRALVSKYI